MLRSQLAPLPPLCTIVCLFSTQQSEWLFTSTNQNLYYKVKISWLPSSITRGKKALSILTKGPQRYSGPADFWDSISYHTSPLSLVPDTLTFLFLSQAKLLPALGPLYWPVPPLIQLAACFQWDLRPRLPLREAVPDWPVPASTSPHSTFSGLCFLRSTFHHLKLSPLFASFLIVSFLLHVIHHMYLASVNT